MKILLTNDDGPFVEGLAALRGALAALGEVTVVCPGDEKSGVGHGITYMTPVRARQVHLADGGPATVLTGTPADCVKFALLEMFDEPPDLVVSGPNVGSNVGVDLFYSGTVAAALEGGFYGVRSVAVSCRRGNLEQMERVARQAVRVLRLLLECWPPSIRVFNVNVPLLDGSEPEICPAEQNDVFPRGAYSVSRDSRGRVHYWLDSSEEDDPPSPESDQAALAAGRITVTPLHLDMTDHAALRELREALAAAGTRK
ncbi:MAG: 5'/3'-nucleotidase SurE [Candidatus Brocadiia bacterium]